MRTQEIEIGNNRSICVFPTHLDTIQQAIAELRLKDKYPVIVLIGGYIPEKYAEATHKAIRTIAKIANKREVLLICGGTDLGVMALIGQVRKENQYSFPLLGITVESLATWAGGPRTYRFLWWGKQRWKLAPNYSHFILTPGINFGDESPWIAETATVLSKGERSVTILANGGLVSKKDIELSLGKNRPVITLAGTGRFADELASQIDKPYNVISIPAKDEQLLTETIQDYL